MARFSRAYGTYLTGTESFEEAQAKFNQIFESKGFRLDFTKDDAGQVTAAHLYQGQTPSPSLTVPIRYFEQEGQRFGQNVIAGPIVVQPVIDAQTGQMRSPASRITRAFDVIGRESFGAGLTESTQQAGMHRFLDAFGGYQNQDEVAKGYVSPYADVMTGAPLAPTPFQIANARPSTLARQAGSVIATNLGWANAEGVVQYPSAGALTSLPGIGDYIAGKSANSLQRVLYPTGFTTSSVPLD